MAAMAFLAAILVALVLLAIATIGTWLSNIAKELSRIVTRLDEIVLALTIEPAPHSAKLVITNSKGEVIMPLEIEVGQSFTAKQHEYFSTTPDPTKETTPPGPLAYISDNVAVATVDATSGVGVGVAVGSTNISALDNGDGLSSTDVLTVKAATPKSAAMELVAG